MTNDDFTPVFIVVLVTGAVFFLTGAMVGETGTRRQTEETTIVYCMEQPKDCRVKYDYYKLENKK